MHIHLFGQLRLYWEERSYPFKALPKVEPLLAYLLLNAETAVIRDAMAFKLWPDVTEKTAKGRLRRHLYDLRRALPPVPEEQPWLIITSQTVQWNQAAPYWLHSAAFEHLCQQPGRWVEAVALYTGSLLPDVDESWVFLARERLHQQFLQTLDKLVQYNWQQQDYRQALFYTRQLLAEDALNEATVRRQMALHFGLGDRATAVQLYHDFTEELYAELEVEPLPETTAVYSAVQQNRPPEHIFSLADLKRPAAPAPVSRPPVFHNIPAPLRPLIGRRRELGEIVHLLTADPQAHLLTLMGVGGIGKTRLAIAVAQQLAERESHTFPDGIFFISLAPLQRPEQVLTAIADVFDLHPRGQTGYLEVVREHLRYRQCLLVLDNFEHVLAAVSPIHDLLQAAPQLQLLVTSRTPLGLYGEQQYPVPALALAEEHEEESESSLFFTAVARATAPHFELSGANRTAVAQICRRLDGLPLAIELAASRSKHFPPDVLLKQLEVSPGLLTSQAQNVPERHRSLEAALQWSFDLLNEQEKRLLTGLSVFVDGFSVAAAAFLVFNKPFADIKELDGETIDLLTSLADKNLIYPAAQRLEGELRFAMLNVVRSFVAQKLKAAARDELMVQLLHYFAQWEGLILQTQGTAEAASWTRRFQLEYKNLSAALDYLQDMAVVPAVVPPDIIKAAGTIASFYTEWLNSGHLHAAQPIFDLVLPQSDHLPAGLHYRINLSAGTLASERGDFEVAAGYLEAAQRNAQQTANVVDLVPCLLQLHGLYCNLEQYEKSLAVIQEAEDLMKSSEIEVEKRTQYQAKTYGCLGISYLYLDELDEAEHYMLLQLASEKERGYLRDVGGALVNLGTVALNQKAWDKAGSYLHESLVVLRQGHVNFSASICVSVMASLAYHVAQYERCVVLHSGTIAWDQRHGIILPERDEQERQEELARCRAELGEQVYRTLWRNGRNLTFDQLVAYALNQK